MKTLLLITGLLLASSTRAQNLDSLYQEALLEIGQFQFEKALGYLSTCYINQPEHVPYLQQIGYCHFQLGRYADAELFYGQALKRDSTNATSLSYLGALAEKQLNLPSAFSYFDQLTRLDSTNSYYFKRKARLASRLRKPLIALENYLLAYRINKSDAELTVALADLYIKLKQLEPAEDILFKGMAIAPKNLRLRQIWARLQNLKKNYPEVIQTVAYCMALGDTTNYFQMMIGAAYVLEDSLDKGIWHLEQVVRRDKASEAALHYLGLAYREKGELEKSKKNLLRAIDKGTSDRLGTYFDDLAAIEENLGETRLALEHLKEARKHDPAPDQLFRLARLADGYYKDKTIATRYYQQYLDTGEQRFRAYSQARLRDLKTWQHMQGGN